METFIFNGKEFECEIFDDKSNTFKFKLITNWCSFNHFFIPNKAALDWLIGLGKEGFWDHSQKCAASNSTLRRFIEQGAIRFNGKIVKPNDMLDFPIFSVVLFPKSKTQYTTLF